MGLLIKIHKSIPGAYLSYGQIKGIFKEDANTIRKISLNPDLDANYGFVECKTQYYRLMFDLDYKEKDPLVLPHIKYHQNITKYLIDKIITAITYMIKDPNVEYIYAIKNQGYGVHLYWPNIILDKELHSQIYELTIELIKIDQFKQIDKVMDIISKIFDESVCRSNGLRLFYNTVNGNYYYPSAELSTFKFPTDKKYHFKFCLINTTNTHYNFELTDDYIKVLKIEKELNSEKSIDRYTEKYIEPEVNKKLFMELIQVLDDDRWNNYNTWIDLVFLFRTYDFKDELIKFSKESNKFDNSSETTINNIFSKPIVVSRKKTIGSLIYWCKSDNYFDTVKVLYNYNIPIKLEIEKSADILLADNYNKTDYVEESKYISENAKQAMLNHKCIIIHSPTGTGKTHTINYLLNNFKNKYPESDYSVCCISSRKTMISTYTNAIQIYSDKNQTSKIHFDNYIESKCSINNYYISSLEFLPYIKRQYHVIVLDEITSLLRHYYSETMDARRYKSFLNLVKLINEADYVICADAIITDFVFKFFDNLSLNYFYYRNQIKNCVGKNMIIYRSELYNINSEIDNFVKMLKKDVQEEKSVLIFSDSKNITEIVFLLLQKYNNNINYYMIINKDSTDLDTITACNTNFLNRCVIVSPKIIYGVDIQICYQNIYCIYKNTNKLNGMSSIEYHQQINRCRNATNSHILFLNLSKYKLSNHFIPFDLFCEIENNRYIEYKNEMNNIDTKYNLIDEMCSSMDFSGNAKIQENLFTPIHYLKTWYDEIFAKNKIELIEMLAREAGYSISYKNLNTNHAFNNTDFKTRLNDFNTDRKTELTEIAKRVVNENVADVKNKIMLEQLLLRSKILKINKCDNIETLLTDEKKYNTFINKKYLDLSFDEFNKFKSSTDKQELSIIHKDNKLISKIDLIFWLENLLKIKRYDINSINIDDVKPIKKVLLEKINSLILLSDGVKSKNGLIKLYQTKINKIETNDNIKSFIADSYNSFGDIILVKHKYSRIKGTKHYTYIKNFILIQ
jgi:hypothetical protein